MVREACPAWAWTLRGLTPAAISSEQNVCRQLWGLWCAGRPAVFRMLRLSKDQWAHARELNEAAAAEAEGYLEDLKRVSLP